MSLCTYAFYDASFETHNVVTNVMDFGAVGTGLADDTAAVQAAIDYVTANGGGDVEVPAGTYLLKGVELKSNVHMLIDAGAVLNLDGAGTMIYIDGHPDWVENVSIQGVGGRFTVNFSQGVSGTRFIQVKKARNFLLSDFHVNGNVSSYSSVVMGVSGFDEATRAMATQGTMRNASISHSSYGYGLIQSQACDSVLFTNLHANGGVALRMETGWDKMGNLQYGGVFNVVGRNISAENAKTAVMMAPVGLRQGLVDIDGVYATNCAAAVTIAAGGLRKLYNPDIFPGSYAEGSSVRNVTAVFGLTAQYKSLPDDIPAEYVNLFSNVSHDVWGAPWIGPSLSVVNNDNERVSVSNVRAVGFEYVPPITGAGYALVEETFFSTNYASTIAGDFWSATTNLDPGGTNWISGNGSIGQMNMAVAEGENHALKTWGFALEDGEDASISSDFRYDHQSGGDSTASLNEAAFGLLFSTDPDSATGSNRYCLLGNQGSGLGFIDDALSEVAHTNLNVDTAVGGWSDWFQLTWRIEQGAVNYQGTPSLYDQSGALLYTGPTVDLDVTNGTIIWAGYTTGTNSVGGSISGFSGLEQVEVDNFVFETSYINEAPVWLEAPARLYAKVNTAYTNSLRGLVLEPNGKLVKYSKLQGPDWLSVEESGWITGTPGALDMGANELELVAEDYEGLASTNTLIMTVSSLSSGSFSLPPVEDATVRGLNPTDNYGTGRTVGIQDHSSKQRIAYLKFDLSQISGDQMTNAFLRLKVTDPDTSMVQAVWSVSDDSWQEDVITYSNRPPVISCASGAPVPVPDLGWWVELNITDYVQAEWSGDQVLSLAVVASNGFQSAYHSKDDMPGHRPELVVQTILTNAAVNTGWNTFASTYGLSGVKTNHSDSDGLNDWGEYVFGGSPTNSADLGLKPVFDATSSNYVFFLIGDSSIDAYVLTNSGLVGGNWGTNRSVTVTSTNGLLSGYTNTIDTSKDKLFIKLLVE
ncbi:CBM96 family carbohydrate-binding protein [Pontiella sulfatireligans]|nr:DNRLRE domain-containing protein [Pontiella sulfatireligans]